jgi:hypothetical protein
LLLTAFSSDDSNFELFCDSFDIDLFGMFEGVKHGRIRKADLPIVSNHYIFALHLIVSFFFKIKFGICVFIAVISSGFTFLWWIFDHLRETRTKEFSLSPLLYEISHNGVEGSGFSRISIGVIVAIDLWSLIIGSYKAALIRKSEFRRCVVFEERAWVISFSSVAGLFDGLKSNIFLHAFDDLIAGTAFKDQTAKVSVYLHSFLLIEGLYIKGLYIILRDHQAKLVSEGNPCFLLKNKSGWCDIQNSTFILCGNKSAIMLWHHVVLDGLRSNATTAPSSTNHVLQSILFHL